MVHAFSLIHDDLPAIDNDDLRRGRPTCHKAFGEAIAILAGDALFALAFETLSAVRAEPDRVVRCLRELSSATGSDGLVGGEVVDVLAEGSHPTPELLHYIHTRKTGSLMAAACAIGAELGGAGPELVRCLRNFGMHLGLAFQIAADILNEVSTPEQLGKAVGSDRQHGKATYPGLHGLDGARRAACEAAEEAGWCLPHDLPNRDLLQEMASFAVHRSH
jgi:geranylgeranyl diphosphate synthase type II